MCVVSMVMDHYQPIFPQRFPDVWPVVDPPTPYVPTTIGTTHFTWPTTVDLAELRKLIDEFKEAVGAAQRIDILTKQPDCEDPEKAKLVDRVAALEERLVAIQKETERAIVIGGGEPQVEWEITQARKRARRRKKRTVAAARKVQR